MASSSNRGERRRHPRSRVYGELSGRIDASTAASIVDLSESGALLELAAALPPGSRHVLTVLLARGCHVSVKMRVIRSYAHHYQSRTEGAAAIAFRTAVEFLTISAEDAALLRNYVGYQRSPPRSVSS